MVQYLKENNSSEKYKGKLYVTVPKRKKFVADQSKPLGFVAYCSRDNRTYKEATKLTSMLICGFTLGHDCCSLELEQKLAQLHGYVDMWIFSV